jgi:hypothetical protein
MQLVRAHLRIHIVLLASVIVTLLGLAAWVETIAFARVFLAVVAVAVAASLWKTHQKERKLAEEPCVIQGSITAVKRGRRSGLWIDYRFLAPNGNHYLGRSSWTDSNATEGNRVYLLFQPEDPSVNKPLERFVFYSFTLDFAKP